MLLRIIKTNQAYNLFLFPLTAVVLWSALLISPREYDFFEGENLNVLFKPIYNLLVNRPFFQVLVSLTLVIILGFIIQKLNNQYAFFRFRTLLPSSLIIILIGGVSSLHSLHPISFAAIFFTLSIDRIFSSFEKKVVNSNAIDAGILLGIGSLFYFNLVYLFPFFVIAMRIVNLNFNWRGLTLIFWGFIIPWIFTFSIFFLADKTEAFINILEQNLFTLNIRIKDNLPMMIYGGLWAFLIFIGGLLIIRQFDKQKISARKYYSVFLILLMGITAIFIFSPSASIEILVLIAIPSSFILSNLFLSIKSRFWSELIFGIFVCFIVYMQFV